MPKKPESDGKMKPVETILKAPEEDGYEESCRKYEEEVKKRV
jgi:hypothetical protein